MATEQDIGWGSYREFEGPYFHGSAAAKYVPAVSPTDAEKIVEVITTTESGNYGAINMYDVGIVSSGLIQWIEHGQYSVSDMLGKVAQTDRALLKPVTDMCLATGYDFHTNDKGRFRFFDRKVAIAMSEVDTTAEQQKLFLLNSNGLKGTWDPASKSYAKKWAAAISTVWEQPAAQKVQFDYTVSRLQQFVLPGSRKILDAAPVSGLGNALRAAFLSFAANNPTWADRSLVKAASQATAATYSLDWLIAALHELTYGFGIAIYPIRYRAIRPVLEQLYGVVLPDFTTQDVIHQSGQPAAFQYDVTEVQQALLLLGFDLGPDGADGHYGDKTRQAILSFEQQNYGETNKVPADHVDGQYDEYTARKLEEVLELRGISALSPPTS